MSERINYTRFEQEQIKTRQPETFDALGGLALTFVIGHSLGMALPMGESINTVTTVEPTAYTHAMEGLVATVEYADTLQRH